MYGYVNGNPISYADPLGLDPMLSIADRAAGIQPGKPDLRGHSAQNQGACELVCGALWPGPLLPLKRVELLPWAGGMISSYFGCKKICEPPKEPDDSCSAFNYRGE